jgi:hypothetical protein
MVEVPILSSFPKCYAYDGVVEIVHADDYIIEWRILEDHPSLPAQRQLIGT